MRQLPPGWIVAKLSDITEYLSRGKQPKYVEHSILPVINQRAIQWSGIQNKYLKYVDPVQFDRWEPERFIQPGDILWNSTGRGTVGRACLVTQEDLEPPKVVDSHVTILRPNQEAINPSFLFAWIQSAEAQDLVESLATGATNQIELGQKAIASMCVPIAPISEQGQITEKLDSLFSRIDECRNRLARMELILKRFRQSVLALSTSGKLTLDWRKNRTYGEENIDDGILPVGWEWKLMSEVGSIQLGRQRAPRYHSGQHIRPYLRVQNVFEDRIDLSDVMEMDFPPQDFEKYQLVYGDILLNEGQSPELLGRPAMYRNELPGVCFTNTLIRFQAFNFVNRDFALLVFRHYMHSGRFMREGKITTNIAHLSAGRFSQIEFPLPPLEEQQEIVNRSNRLLAFADNIESRYQNALTKLDKIKTSVLFRAFRGELVSQQGTSESASILIEKVRLAKTEKDKKEAQIKAKRKPPMSKLSKKTVRDVILALPEKVFEFEDLRGKVSGDYDSLRDILFDLLSEHDSIINQFFDGEAKIMKFSRRNQ